MKTNKQSLRTIQILKDLKNAITEDDIRKNTAAFCIYDSLNARIDMIEDTLADSDEIFSLGEMISSLIEVLTSDCEDNFEGEDKEYAEKFIEILTKILAENE